MCETHDKFTMDDTELTVLALEIMDDLQNLSIKPSLDPTDSYMFKLDCNDDIIDDIIDDELYYSTDNDDEGDMLYIAYPTEAMTITSLSSNDSLHDILPPIPPCNSAKIQHAKTQTMTKINIAGNKKRGIKRWSKRHKKGSYSPSPSVDDIKKHKKTSTMKQRKCNKKKKRNIQRKYGSDEIDININIPNEPLPYFVKRGNTPISDVFSPMDDTSMYPILSPMNSSDYDDNKNPFRRSLIIENKARKSKKKKKAKKKRKKGTTKKSATPRPKRSKRRKCKVKKRPITPVSDTITYSAPSRRYIYMETK